MAIPIIRNDELVRENARPLRVGTRAWFQWLNDDGPHSFAYQTPGANITLRREQKRNTEYWYAYRTRHGKLHKVYVGKTDELTVERLRASADRLSQDAAAGARVHLELFGSPRARRGSKVLVLNAKSLALLAFLSAHAQPIAREKILALLWQDSAPDAARKNLRNLLWQIRVVLGSDAVSGEHELALNPTLECDVLAFRKVHETALTAAPVAAQRARQAMRKLYRGALLDGFALNDAPEFEVWLVGAREQFEEAYGDALQALVDTARAQGRWREVSDIAHAAISREPLQEPMYRALMQAHAHLGDRAAALRHYDTLRETLDRELGVEPLPETRTLRAAIAEGTLTEDRQPPTSSRPHKPEQGRAPKPTGETARTFVGRTRELQILQTVWREAEKGKALAVVLAGEAGIGKSRLWQQWSDTLAPRIARLAARALPTTSELPFAPLVDLVRTPILQDRLLAQAQEKSPAWLVDISRLTPELRERIPQLAVPPALPPVEEQRHIFEALTAALGVSPARPQALFLDDLQWADRTTLDWLGYLLHRLRDLPFLFVGAYRQEDAAPALVTVLAQWGREGLLTRVMLERLNRGESIALLGALRGSVEHAEALYAQSAGNPYFLIELARAGAGELPAALSDLIQARLARLDETARQILQAAIVIQEEITFPLLLATAGRTDDETLDALDVLHETGLLVEQDGRYSPGHPLIGAVVDRGLSGARRERLHQRAANALERIHSHELPAVAGRLMRHWIEARQPERAAEYGDMAAERAMKLAAWTEAISLYERAYALAPAPARLYGLGNALTWAGKMEQAGQVYRRALAAYEQANDTRGAARVAIEIARSYLSTGKAEQVVEWIQRGRAYLDAQDDLATQALAEYLMGAELRAAGHDLAQAEGHFTNGIVFARQSGASKLIGETLLELGNVRAQRGDLPGAIETFRELVAHAQNINDINSRVIGYNNLAYHLLLDGQVAQAQDAIEQGLQLADEFDMQLPRQWLYSTRGEVALALAQWDEAEEWFVRGMTEAERLGNREQLANYEMNRALAARGRGQSDDALLQLERARTQARSPFLLAEIDLWLTQVYLERRERTAARAVLTRAEAMTQSGNYRALGERAAQLRAALG